MPGVMLDEGDKYLAEAFKSYSVSRTLRVEFLTGYITPDPTETDATIAALVSTDVSYLDIGQTGNVQTGDDGDGGQYAYIKTGSMAMTNTSIMNAVDIYGYAIKDMNSGKYIYLVMFDEAKNIEMGATENLVVKFGFNKKPDAVEPGP